MRLFRLRTVDARLRDVTAFDHVAIGAAGRLKARRGDVDVEGRVVAVHLHQHDLVVIVFRDQHVELQAAFLVQFGAGGMATDDLKKGVALARFDVELDDEGDFAHGFTPTLKFG